MDHATHVDAHGHHGEHAAGFHHPHVVAGSLFFKVLAALLVLTIVTVLVSRVDFGSANLFIAMAIAAVKASLVMTFFMHLRWDTAINNIAIISSFLFLSLLFIFTLSDIATRRDTDRVLVESPGNTQLLQQARDSKMHR
jgi:cytochrome c oxidase subunit 4